jgi:hypothetical protein
MGRNAKYQLRRDVFVGWGILESAAFQTLSAAGIRILLRFLQKRTWVKVKKKTIYENGGLSFTYTEANLMGIKGTTFYEAIVRLIEIGFIDLEHQGGAYGKDYSRYVISERWRDFGTDNFQRVEKRRSLQRGMDVRNHMRRKIETPTEKRSGQLRKSVVMDEKGINQGIGNP